MSPFSPAFGIDSSFGFRARHRRVNLAIGERQAGSRTLFGASMSWGRNRMEHPTPARYTTTTPRAEMGRERLRIDPHFQFAIFD